MDIFVKAPWKKKLAPICLSIFQICKFVDAPKEINLSNNINLYKPHEIKFAPKMPYQFSNIQLCKCTLEINIPIIWWKIYLPQDISVLIINKFICACRKSNLILNMSSRYINSYMHFQNSFAQKYISPISIYKNLYVRHAKVVCHEICLPIFQMIYFVNAPWKMICP